MRALEDNRSQSMYKQTSTTRVAEVVELVERADGVVERTVEGARWDGEAHAVYLGTLLGV